MRHRPTPFVNLRSFCEFWVDQRASVACCQFADDETLEQEPELFDCAACPVRQAVSGLEADNSEAWNLFHRLASRFLVDAHLLPDLFRLLTADWPPTRTIDMLDRLQLIYDILQPPQTPSS